MSRPLLSRAAVLVLVVAAWLRFPAVGRAEAPLTDADPATLVRALGDPSESVRFQAMAELMRIGRPATRELAQALLDTKPIADDLVSKEYKDYREQKVSRSDLAFTVLLQIPDAEIDELLEAYRSAPPEPSEPARKLLIEEAPPRQRIRMVLEQVAAKPTERASEALRGGDPALQVILAEALGRAGPKAAEAVPLLAKVVAEDSHDKVRAAAASALAQIPEGGLQALRSLLGHVEPKVRSAALAAYPAHREESGELVARALKDPVQEVRQTALKRIGGPEEIYRDADDDSCQRAEDGQPAIALLAALPSSALPDIETFARATDERTRQSAVQALGSLACARRDLAPVAVETLVEAVSDPADKVVTEALRRLNKLAKLNAVPGSPEILDKLLSAFATPPEEEGLVRHDDVLEILEQLDLPEARRNEIIDALLIACSNETVGCGHAQAILSARPAWQKASVEALSAHYPDVRSFDSRTLYSLESFGGSDSSGSTKLLEQLLGHPERQLRVRAAIDLAARGDNPDRIWSVLAEGARSYDGGWNWDQDAAQTLACLGERGVAQLIAVDSDPMTGETARDAILTALAEVANESPQAADFLLATAANTEDPNTQSVAIRALAALQTRPADVKSTLEQTFATDDVTARNAVVWAWYEIGLAPGGLVERALSDPEPAVRREAFMLLWLLPKDDPRRLMLTKSALQDKDKQVRDEALLFAGELGEPGAALLDHYVASGKPLTGSVFDGIERLGSLGDALTGSLEARAADAPAWELERILSILGSFGAEAPEERERLYTLLDAADPADRRHAAQGLLTLGEDPWACDGRLAVVLTEAGVREIVRERLQPALDPLYAVDIRETIEVTATRVPQTLPRIPWPPPPGYRPPVVVPRELFGPAGKTTLGDVYEKLDGALEAVSHGFEHGLFAGPSGGFALVARMERIQPDGTPFPEPARWLKEGSPKLSLMDLLADLFFERSGYFRVIVFAVTSDLAPGHDPRATLPEPSEGAPMIPTELARLPFKDQEVLALVYSFERRRDAKITPWEDGAPSALQHLEKAGVWTRLGTSK